MPIKNSYNDKLKADKVVMLDESITPNNTVDIAKYKRQQFEMFGGDTKKVTFIIDPKILDVIFDKFGSNVKIHSLDDGTLSCTAEIQQSPIFINWCCSFGSRLKVVSPPSTIEKIKEHLKEVQDLYE